MSAFGDHHRGGDPTHPPLFLVHGFTATWPAWGPVLGLLEEQFDVLAPTVGGHTGGLDLEDASLDGILDGLEAMLDEVGWDTAHIAGWSMGGQLALELAVRGRAQSVTAISPAGAWTHGTWPDRAVARLERFQRRAHSRGRRGARFTPRVMASPRLRGMALRDQMIHGERMAADEALSLAEAFVETPAFSSLLDKMNANDRPLEGLDRIDVPTTIAWGDTDRVLPKDKHEAFFREHLPHAKFVTFVKAGHTPFWDAPERVADTIAQTALGVERSHSK